MSTTTFHNRLQFVGRGTELFGIYIVNLLLTAVTLGLYYPWARAALLQYTYGRTQLDDVPFQFHGTGREMFIGFIKAFGIFLALYGSLVAVQFSGNSTLILVVTLAVVACFVLLAPVAIHGALRYRLSRTSWQGVHFGYRGDLGELVRLFVKGVLLTLVTFGIYGFWFRQELLRYTIGHVRAGSAQMRYDGDGGNYLALNIKGYFLTFLTLGIYAFWWGRDLIRFTTDHTRIEHEGETYRLRSSLTVGQYAGTLIGNFLLVVFTLGLATPWAIARTLRMLIGNVQLDERFEPTTLLQTELEYRDATGDDLTDLLDLNLI